ncbi:MAG: DUF2889 domain-containing protein [Gammaproteobacteria bacterium]
MPLPDPTRRKLSHTRQVILRGYERDDGLWDIEGHLVDSKTYAFSNRDRGEVKAGEPVHAMWLRITVDDDLKIHDAVASTDAAPFKVCPLITTRYQRLIGLSIGPGWGLKIKQLFNGVEGCTHLTELLGPLATTAYQTLFARREERARANPDHGRPQILDTCHALASDGEVVKSLWPQFYSGSAHPRSEPA